MRIAYIVHRFPCLSEPFIMDQITGMLDLGQKIAIFAEAGPTRDPVHPQVEAYKLIQRTRYLPGRPGSRLEVVLQAGKTALTRPRFVAESLRDRQGRLSDALHSLSRLHGFVWPPAVRPDIVHCQFGCVARTHWRSKKLWGARLVVSFRGHDFSSLPKVHGPGMYQELFQQVDAVMAVCDYAAARLLELGCPAEKLVTHYSGTDVTDFAYRKRTLPPDELVRILTVARLEESKGIKYALRAVADLIHDRGLKVHYGIVGGGSLRDHLEELAAALKIQNHVTFFGPQSRPRVRDLVQAHQVFLLPSVTTVDGGQEGIPGSIREAMATGMPVVSTLHSGIPELVTHGVSGYLVPERDVAALTDRLHQLVTTPASWAEMGRVGREQVERRFEIRQLNRRLEAFYRHVLAGRVPAEFPGGEASEINQLAAR